MSATRILYVASEIEPFLKVSDVADFVRKLPQAMQEKGMEIRILMPRFGIINERKNRLHEVVRLSGINIPVGGEEHPLVIKVASIPSAKLQVYFIDNEDYFKRKTIFHDKNNIWHEDNDERAIFFCKGVLETIKKLGWAPDIIHCNDWMTGLIPLYLKTAYKDEPMFKDSKVIFSVYNNESRDTFNESVAEKAMMQDVELADLSGLCEGCSGFINLGASNADLILDLTTIEGGSSISSSAKKISAFESDEAEIESYFTLYNELLNK